MVFSPPPIPSSRPSNSPPYTAPKSILIVGSGVYGLSVACSIAQHDAFSECSITVVDRSDPSNPNVFPSPDAASVDTSRIVRTDYADEDYAELAMEGQVDWRQRAKHTDLGAEGRYHECGFVVVGDEAPDVIDEELTGMGYARSSYEKVLSLTSRHPEHFKDVRVLPDVDAIRTRLGTGGVSGTWGYVNEGSGWADPCAAMAWLLQKVRDTGRVSFVSGTVDSLERDGGAVTGALLNDGRVLSADLTIVAAGAWTGGLVDLSGQVTATGQVLGYISLTQEEQERLDSMPVVANMTTGIYVIPPKDRVLKVAQHAYGYVNPVSASPLPSSPKSPASSSVISLPMTQFTNPSIRCIPERDADRLRRALGEIVPGLADRPFMKTRLCWYSDTLTGHPLIDYHPGWKGIFIATGDSGHCFKFMPVLGDKILDCIMGRCPIQFRKKWAWKTPSPTVVTRDGSRGGEPGLKLADALASTETM